MKSKNEYTIHPIPRIAGAHLQLSYAEEALWWAHQSHLGTNAYTADPLAVFLRRGNVDAVRQAIDLLMKRHEILRTTFPSGNSTLRRYIHEVGDYHPRFVDFTWARAHDRKHAITEWMTAEYDHPFSLEEGPLCRWSILADSAEDFYIQLTIHHIITDARSQWIIVREFLFFYRQCLERRAPTRLSPRVQYADYAAWQRERLNSATLAVLQEYWTKQLNGVPECVELPLDNPRNAGMALTKQIKFSVPGDLRSLIIALTVRERTTAFVFLLSAFKLLLHKWSESRCIVVGVPINNRWGPVEDMVGLFLDFVAIRTDFSRDSTFTDVLRRVHNAVIDAHHNSAMPITLLIRTMRLSLAELYAPLFQVVFNYRNESLLMGRRTPFDVEPEAGRRPSVSETQLVKVPVRANRAAKYDLVLSVSESEELMFFLTYNSKLFTHERMNDFARQYVRVLAEAVGYFAVDPSQEAPIF